MAMKRLILMAALCGGSGALRAQSSIVAKMTNLRNDKGVCRVCLFDRPEAFNEKGGTPLRCVVAPVRNRAAEAAFTDLAPGTYAVFVFHDANNNDRFDTNWMGIPKEGYGASRNNLPFAAAPSFNGNKITITAHTTTTLNIRLRNL
ncbi:MAG: DUF2141 domain-containing protein [Chitinophagaceae bacterium]|nr:MAG: DUF2141 domain-containing protein [Chitinophagaceae bacterium]